MMIRFDDVNGKIPPFQRIMIASNVARQSKFYTQCAALPIKTYRTKKKGVYYKMDHNK